MCFEGIASHPRRVSRRFVPGSREISLVSSLHRASTDALIKQYQKDETKEKDRGEMHHNRIEARLVSRMSAS